jgi:hypothetical protein
MQNEDEAAVVAAVTSVAVVFLAGAAASVITVTAEPAVAESVYGPGSSGSSSTAVVTAEAVVKDRVWERSLKSQWQ